MAGQYPDWVAGYQLLTLGTNAELLELPFDLQLEDWPDERFVYVPRGISRHVVRFVDLEGDVFAVKEAPDRFVLNEHAMLHELAARNVPVVDAFGTVTERSNDEGPLPGLLITRHLPYSQPYRTLFTGRGMPELRTRLLDALAGLFVRLHLAGFYWGDCSLSNTLFRRDAGALAAYLVDAETGEIHPELSVGQRFYDLQIAVENIAGEMFDLEAAGRLDPSIDVIATAAELTPRYEQLWDELTRDEVVGRSESYLINQRIKRLNSLGFDVAEMAIRTENGGRRLRFETAVVEPGHHTRLVLALTGLHVQENQARTLLADLARFRAKWEEATGESVAEDLAARRWLDQKFYGTLALVPADQHMKLPDAELFHEISEHRWFLSEERGEDVGRAAAVTSYVETILRNLPDERVDLAGPATEEFVALSE
jgi:hypothetical protein